VPTSTATNTTTVVNGLIRFTRRCWHTAAVTLRLRPHCDVAVKVYLAATPRARPRNRNIGYCQ
jgi:hypothetical protein